MDQQRPFLYLTLMFLGFLIWSSWQTQHAPKTDASNTPPTKQSQLSPNSSNTLNSAEIPSSVAANVPDDSTLPGSTVETQNTENGANQIHVKTDVLDLTINLKGGSIVQADLPTYPVSLEEKNKPIRIIDKNMQYTAQSGLIHRGSNSAKRAPNHYAQFKALKKEYILADGQTKLVVPISWTNQQGITVTKRYIFERGKFLIHLEQQINNQSQKPWVGNEYLQLTHGEHKRKRNIMSGAVAYVGAAYYNDKYSKISFSDIEDGELKPLKPSEMTEADKEKRYIKGGWAAMIQHYFVSAWVPQKDDLNTYYTNYITNKKLSIIGIKSPEKTINPGSSDTFKSQFYVGPAIQSELSKIAKGLDLTVDYGIFAFVSKPIFAVMNFIHKYVGNWGWTIILLTVLIKILFFYPSAIGYRSTAKMKKLAPKIKAINEKYKNDPQAKQKETFAFYKREKFNPMGGCLPMLIQMPVFMGLYWVLLESVELRQAPWILWYKDLSIMDPFFVLPILYGISFWFQQKLNPPMMQDPMQQKIFTYLPLVFTVMFLFFPAGLVLYWLVNNLLGMFQQWYITKKIMADDG